LRRESNRPETDQNQPLTVITNGPKLSLKDTIGASISRGKLVSGTNGRNRNGNGNSTASSVATFANPFWIEMAVIGKRSLTNSRRMPELFGIRLCAVKFPFSKTVFNS
jgi:hypothetical protein